MYCICIWDAHKHRIHIRTESSTRIARETHTTYILVFGILAPDPGPHAGAGVPSAPSPGAASGRRGHGQEGGSKKVSICTKPIPLTIQKGVDGEFLRTPLLLF